MAGKKIETMCAVGGTMIDDMCGWRDEGADKSFAKI